MRFVVETLGCKANLADSQAIEAGLRARGWVAGGDPDVCVVNSCTVTDEAERASRRAASRLARRHPGARVVMTGCSAEVDPHALLSVRGVSHVVANRDKGRLPEWIDRLAGQTGAPAKAEILGGARGYGEMRSRHPHDREWPLPEALFLDPGGRAPESASRRTRAFLKVQEGCDSFCTFCVIPYGRGPSRSLPRDEAVARVRELAARGAREVVLTGTNLGDYGGGPGALLALVEAILAGTPVERLRLSSLDPSELLPALVDLAAAEPRLCPHFHVSLQSARGRVLRRMKRGYGEAGIESALGRLAALEPRDAGGAPLAGGAYVGMDVIAGFPGETEEDFEEGYRALAALPWTRLHVFPYSERAGTPAARMTGAVPAAVRAERARRLAALSFLRVREHYERAKAETGVSGGILPDVLLESRARGPDGTREWFAGHTPNYLRVLVPAGRAGAAPNASVRVRVGSVATDPSAGDCAFLAELEEPVLRPVDDQRQELNETIGGDR